MLGTGSYMDIVDAVRAALSGKKSKWMMDQAHSPIMAKRTLLGPALFGISEGGGRWCDNRCAYCVIRVPPRPLSKRANGAAGG